MRRTINLNFISILDERIARGEQLIQVLLGPRQVGKTTTILQMIQDRYAGSAHYVSTEDAFNPTESWLRDQWLLARSQKKLLIIDEVHKVEHWSQTLKALHDQAIRQRELVQCVVLGSSALDLQRGLTESLAGRFQLVRAYHWSYAESRLGYDLSFEDYLKFGGYPGSYRFIGTSEWADYVKNSIIATVVEKDILQFRSVKSPALFRQTFSLLMSYPAQEISYTKLLGQLQDRGNVELVKNYISLFEGAFLLKALEKFSDKPTIRRGSSPKILPLAPCLPYLELRGQNEKELSGRLFEVTVGSQLVRTGEDIFYWRDGNLEVDFVVRRGRAIWGIEVKTGRKRRQGGLLAFKKRFPSAKLTMITPENYESFEREPIKFLESEWIDVA